MCSECYSSQVLWMLCSCSSSSEYLSHLKQSGLELSHLKQSVVIRCCAEYNYINGKCDQVCLLGCDAVQSVENEPQLNLLPTSYWFLARFTLLPWKWRRYAPPKHLKRTTRRCTTENRTLHECHCENCILHTALRSQVPIVSFYWKQYSAEPSDDW
jgi:hypothetical protein